MLQARYPLLVGTRCEPYIFVELGIYNYITPRNRVCFNDPSETHL